MPKISDKPLIRTHVRLWAEDVEALDQMFGSGDLSRSKAIRDIVHEYVKHTRVRAQAEIDSIPPLAEADLAELEEVLR